MPRPFAFASAVVLLLVVGVTSRAAEKEKRLDYRQQQSLKDAKFYVEQAERIVGRMEMESAGWKIGDAAVPIDKVKALLAERDKAAQTLKNARARLEKLPPNHSEVAPVARRWDETKDALAAAESPPFTTSTS